MDGGDVEFVEDELAEVNKDACSTSESDIEVKKDKSWLVSESQNEPQHKNVGMFFDE